MLKTITKNVFDVVAGLTMIAAVFYLAAITHIVPVPENTLSNAGPTEHAGRLVAGCGGKAAGDHAYDDIIKAENKQAAAAVQIAIVELMGWE